jgi:hypothetical protein
VDGTKSTYNFFDAYCYSYRESSFFFNTGENTHVVKIYPGISLSLQEKEQILVADRRSDIQQNPSIYQHNYFIFSKILINGTTVTGQLEPEDHSQISYWLQGRRLYFSVPAHQVGNILALYDIKGALIYKGYLDSTVFEVPLSIQNGLFVARILEKNSSKYISLKIAVK